MNSFNCRIGRWKAGLLAPIVLVSGMHMATAAVLGDACNTAHFQTTLHHSPGATSTNTGAQAPVQSRAYWLNRHLIKWPGVDAADRFKLYHSVKGSITAEPGSAVTGADSAIVLTLASGPLPASVAERFKFVANGVLLAVTPANQSKLGSLLKRQIVLVQEDAAGKVRRATALQIAGALDDLYRNAAHVDDLGVTVAGSENSKKTLTHFKLWAPTAYAVSVCIYESGNSRAIAHKAMRWNANTGVWSVSQATDMSGKYYTYLVDVFVPGIGMVRNRATDPYSISLSTDSKRSYIASLDSPSLKPSAWDSTPAPARVAAQTDMMIYELHVRDFSINDASVSAIHRGKYTAFTEANSKGMQHLKSLSAAGLTDIHLLPVFDIATIPESGCVTPKVSGAPDGETQQAAVVASAGKDCFNWGYDPFHFTAPEGSYATDAANGARRIIEFRQMVQALHKAGLRVGMDVVYNHTAASGQAEKSVLDRIVPGYYHRLNADGAVERSTCCDNTATENMMMGKLMIDSAVVWAQQYKIDSFRFDLMGHQPRAVMLALKERVNKATGRDIHLIGEGWNFGEVADGARFVQASQLSLNGSGIGTFSDRARDAVRGGGPGDQGADLVTKQGYINGLVYDRNAQAAANLTKSDLMKAADMVRVGLAGSVRDYVLQTQDGQSKPLGQIDYNGQPAGYVSQPGEVVNYVDNHDNHTLFDINVLKLPVDTTAEDRARVQMLGMAITAFSQGVAYFHAGIETLRSKSMDRNSYDSGDWFNRLDWTFTDNGFAGGLPPRTDNGKDWLLIKPLLANAAIKPAAADIAFTRDAFRDLLKIRASSTLFRMRGAQDIKQRLTFYNTGPSQSPAVLVGHLNGAGYADARFGQVLYFINVDKTAQQITIAQEQGKAYVLHPVHLQSDAADKRPAASAFYEAATGQFTIPPRSVLVYVVN